MSKNLGVERVKIEKPPAKLPTEEYDFLARDEQRWVDAFIGAARGSHSLASRMVGVSNLTGRRYLAKPSIQAAIQERLNEFSISAEQIVYELAQQATGNVLEFYDIDDHGLPVLNLKKPGLHRKFHLVEEVIFNKAGHPVGVRLYSAQDALKLLAQIRGMLDTNVNHRVSGNIQHTSFEVNIPAPQTFAELLIEPPLSALPDEVLDVEMSEG